MGTMMELHRCQMDLRGIVLFYWPGDYSRWEIVSAMNYPKTVPIAQSTAQLLAEYLQKLVKVRRRSLQLSFIAHSLGSLVVLETIRRLRIECTNVSIRDVLLMAAAVPVGFCASDELYGKRFRPNTREVALYSQDDVVLKRYFQLGQEIARQFPRQGSRRAVGRTGGPGAGAGRRWHANVEMDEFDHSDYWREPESIAEIADVLARSTGRTSVSYHPRRETNGDRMRVDALPRDVLEEDDYISSDYVTGYLGRPVEP
jgi:esterase/lipase superfamily enzyme